MRSILIAAVLLAAAGPALADYIAHDGEDTVRLTTHACSNDEVKKVIEAHGQQPEDFRQAHARISGKEWDACWQPAEGGAALVYPDGDRGLMPREWFKPAPEA